MDWCTDHRSASTGKRAIADTVIPATPATTPSNARSDAGSSSATPDREAARAPQTTALTPRMNPSPDTQNDAMDNAPSRTDTEGNRDRPRGTRGRAGVEELSLPVAPELHGVAAFTIPPPLPRVARSSMRRDGVPIDPRAAVQPLSSRNSALGLHLGTAFEPSGSRRSVSSFTQNLALALVEC